MPHRIGNFKYPLLGQQRLHFIAGNNVAFFESFDSEVFAGIFVPGKDDLSEVTAAEDRHKVEALQSHD